MDSHQTTSPPPPLSLPSPETVGEEKLCKKEAAAAEPCMQVLVCNSERTGVHASSLHATATPIHSWWDWMVLVNWHNTK